MSDFSAGEIITFYSYKGGTGRSMALANVACVLAQEHETDKDILLIDWDLEAPGLHQFFHGRFYNSKNEKGDLPSGQLGLIDLFYEIRERLEKSKLQSSILDDLFSEIDIRKYTVKIKEPSLLMMPAGNYSDGKYSTRVNAFDWAVFFEKYPLVIPRFAEHLREKYRYVLIDSRTGYTDTSGICTSIMPEKLVTVFTPNRQSLSGVVEIIRQAINYRKLSDDIRPMVIYPLPSRIENAENKLQKEWRFGNLEQGVGGYQAQLESVLADVYGLDGCDLTEYFDKYQLQYVPKYSYGEEIAVLSERSEERLSLARSYEEFSSKITSDENPWIIAESVASQFKPKIKTPLKKEDFGQTPTDIKSQKDRSSLLRLVTIAGVFVAIFTFWFIVFNLLGPLQSLISVYSMTSTPTPIPSVPGIVGQQSFCYNGPNESYPTVAIAREGLKIGILGKNSDGGDWFLVQEKTINRCWIKSSNVTILENDVSDIFTVTSAFTETNGACYTYPDSTSDLQTFIPKGWRIVIVGKSDLQAAWLVVTPHDSTESCWIRSDVFSLTSADLLDVPVNPVIVVPTKTPEPISITWKLVNYDCSNGLGRGALIDLEISGGIQPYTTSPEMPLYAQPNELISITVMSDSTNGEPSKNIKFTIPDASDNSFFKCDPSAPTSTPRPVSPTPPPPTNLPAPTPTLCWPPGHCK